MASHSARTEVDSVQKSQLIYHGGKPVIFSVTIFLFDLYFKLRIHFELFIEFPINRIAHQLVVLCNCDFLKATQTVRTK